MEDLAERQHIVNEPAATRTTAGDAFSAFAITALRLAGHLTIAGDQISKPAEQNSARWQVLASAHHSPMSVAQIAKSLGLARQGIQRLANALEAEGYISYVPNPHHQRAKLVQLTDEGERKLAIIQAGQAVWADALGARIGEVALKTATKVMVDVLVSLGKET